MCGIYTILYHTEPYYIVLVPTYGLPGPGMYSVFHIPKGIELDMLDDDLLRCFTEAQLPTFPFREFVYALQVTESIYPVVTFVL